MSCGNAFRHTHSILSTQKTLRMSTELPRCEGDVPTDVKPAPSSPLQSRSCSSVGTLHYRRFAELKTQVNWNWTRSSTLKNQNVPLLPCLLLTQLSLSTWDDSHCSSLKASHNETLKTRPNKWLQNKLKCVCDQVAI